MNPSYGPSPTQFFEQSGLPSALACMEQPEKYYRWAFDFDQDSGLDTASTSTTTLSAANWKLTQYNSTGWVSASAALQGGAWLLSSGGASINDGVQVQLVPSLVKVTAGKKYGFAARFKVDVVADALYFVGLAEAGCTKIHSSGDFDTKQFVGFGTDTTTAGASLYLANSGSDATEIQTDTTVDPTDDTFLWVFCAVNGASYARFMVVADVATVATSYITEWFAPTKLPDAGSYLAPLIGVGDVTTNTCSVLSIDYMEVRAEMDRFA